MTPPSRRPKWVAVALAALVLVAFVERWIGLSSRLPHEREADTAMVHVAAFHDRPAGAPMTDAAYPSTVYPLLCPRILIALPGSNYPQATAADAPLPAQLAAASEPYLRARRLVALLSLLIVPCTYLLARSWLGRRWSVFAAALATTSLLVVEMSPLAKPHGALAGLNALALVAIVRLVRSGSLRAYVLAGLTSALALACLNSGFFVLPSFALAHWLGWRADHDRKRWRGLALAAAICAGGFLVGYPFLVFGDPLQSTASNTLNFGQQAIEWSTWGFDGFRDMLPGMWSRDPVLVVVAALGIVLFAIRCRRARVSLAGAMRPETLVLGLHVLVMVVLFGIHERFYPRYFIPIVPALCILGAHGLRALCDGLFPGRTRMRNAAVAFAALLVLALPARSSAQLSIERARDDTEQLAAHWIEAHVPPDSGVIAVDFSLSLPLLQKRDSIREMPAWSWRPWQRYQMEILSDSPGGVRWDLRTLFERSMYVDRRIEKDEVLRRLDALDATWAVVTVTSDFDARRDETRAAVRERAGEPVALIDPSRPGWTSAAISKREYDEHFREHVAAVVRLGPSIEIYKLR